MGALAMPGRWLRSQPHTTQYSSSIASHRGAAGWLRGLAGFRQLASAAVLWQPAGAATATSRLRTTAVCSSAAAACASNSRAPVARGKGVCSAAIRRSLSVLCSWRTARAHAMNCTHRTSTVHLRLPAEWVGANTTISIHGVLSSVSPARRRRPTCSCS